VNYSGTRVESLAGKDHLKPWSNRVFRYIFAIGDQNTNKSDLPAVLEGREVINPEGYPDGTWEVRIRDIDFSSESYGSILRVIAYPGVGPKEYHLEYDIHSPSQAPKKVRISSPLPTTIHGVNPDLPDLADPIDVLGKPVAFVEHKLQAVESATHKIQLNNLTTANELTQTLNHVLALISDNKFKLFRHNLDEYEAFGDFGSKSVHPGTNLVGPNVRLAAESIFVRQYRSALVLLGRVVSPDMAEGNVPRSFTVAPTNTRPGVYVNFVGATINHIGIYKLGLDKVHGDYGGVPMKLAPGSKLENDAVPIVDPTKANQTLGEIAYAFYLNPNIKI